MPVILTLPQNFNGTFASTHTQTHLSVKAPRPLQRRVQCFCEVGGRHNDDALIGLKPILHTEL